MNAFCEAERLPQSKVDTVIRRTRQLIPPLVTECSRGWYRKSSLVKPLVGATVLQLGGAALVWEPIKVVPRQRVGIGSAGHDRGKRLAALHDERSRQLPSADHFVEQRAVVQELPALSKRKLIDPIAPESIANIEVGVPIVCRRNKGVLNLRGASVASPARGVVITQEVRPHIAEVQIQTLAHAFLNHSLQRVVIGNRILISRSARSVQRSELRERPGSLIVRRQQSLRHLVDIYLERQVVTMSGHVAQLCHEVVSYLALGPQVPLIGASYRFMVSVEVEALSVVGIGSSR